MSTGMFLRHLKITLAVLVVGNTISTMISANLAGGDSGWWPIYFVLVLMVSLAYSVAFSAIASARGYKIYPVAYVHIVLALLSILLIVLYYKTTIDWGAINSGAEKTVLEIVLSSDYTIYFMHVGALLLAVFVGAISKSRETS